MSTRESHDKNLRYSLIYYCYYYCNKYNEDYFPRSNNDRNYPSLIYKRNERKYFHTHLQFMQEIVKKYEINGEEKII